MGSRELTPSQQAALSFVAEQGRAQRDKARERLAHVAKMSNIADRDLDETVQRVRAHARVALHFHPDRPVSGSATVAERLLAEGTYRSQFESKISNGSVSAYPGGERDLWEQRLFGGAYQGPGSQLRERPKYGSLDLMRHSDGPSPRFGSCYLLLDPLVTRRCTFTYLDSHQQRDEKGTLAEFRCRAGGALRGELLSRLRDRSVRPDADRTRRAPSIRAAAVNLGGRPACPGPATSTTTSRPRCTEMYCWARTCRSSWPISSFRGSETGAALQELATRYAVDLHWHRGFELEVANVPSDFRGPTMPSLADRVAGSGPVNAREIGGAVRSLERDPAAWVDRGTPAEVLQELKLLWHCVVKFGAVNSAAAR